MDLAEAIPLLRDERFDCAIIDMDLPETKGFEAVKIVRALSPHLPIITTVESNSKQLEEKVRGQNVFYYHIKSFDLQELKWAVEGIFNKLGKTGAVGRGTVNE